MAVVVAERAHLLQPSGPPSPKLRRASWVLLRYLIRGNLLLPVLRLLKAESEGQRIGDAMAYRILSVARR